MNSIFVWNNYCDLFFLIKIVVMKKPLLIIGLLIFGTALLFEGCRTKPGSNPESPKTMNDLIVSANFDWSTTKTIQVYITLPEERPGDMIKIFSIDGAQLFYAGYGDKISNVINTTITLASRHEMVKLMYGNDNRYKEVIVSAGDEIAYNYNDFKSEPTDDDCDLSGFSTFSQGGWGSKAHGNNPGAVRDAHWEEVFPNGLTAGDPSHYTIHLSSSEAARDFLPGGGKSKELSKSYTDPKSKQKIAGNWGGQIVAAIMNVEYDRKGFMGTNSLELGQLVFKEGEFEDLSVDEFLVIANKALGGGGLSGYSINDIQNAAEIINLNFENDDDKSPSDGGDNDYLTCPESGSGTSCGCKKGLRTLTMTFNGNSAALVTVKEKKGNRTIFNENLNPGDNFNFHGTGSDNKMDKTIYFYIDGNLNISMHTSCSVDIFKGDNYGDFIVVDGTSKDELHLCEGSSSACGCEKGLRYLRLRYDGSATAHIVVKEKKKNHKVFDGDIDADDWFSFTGSSKNGKFKGNEIRIYVDDALNTSIHTSCSQDIEVGDTYGDFTILAGSSNKNLPLCGTASGGGGQGGIGGGGSTTTNLNGTLAYEDLWPGKGDYDFNDLVINYEFAVTKDDQERVQNISATFIIYAYGASFHNGFGFEFPSIAPNKVIRATGYDIVYTNIFDLASNGLENNQSNASFIVYDDSWRIMPPIDPAIGVNTEQDKAYVTPDTLTMQIVFYENGSFAPGGPVTYTELDIGNFNPFIVVDKDRSVEVHLPDYSPTDLADQSYFGTYEDNSIPADGRYYKTSNNLPWCIKIPEVFEYPVEKQDVTGAYNHFAEWAESDGALYPDWYQNTSGYRNSSAIYQKPAR